MSRGTSKKRLTQPEFIRIKSLLRAGVRVGQIKRAMGRSYNVIYSISKTNDFPAYQAYVNDDYKKRLSRNTQGLSNNGGNKPSSPEQSNPEVNKQVVEILSAMQASLVRLEKLWS